MMTYLKRFAKVCLRSALLVGLLSLIACEGVSDQEKTREFSIAEERALETSWCAQAKKAYPDLLNREFPTLFKVSLFNDYGMVVMIHISTTTLKEVQVPQRENKLVPCRLGDIPELLICEDSGKKIFFSQSENKLHLPLLEEVSDFTKCTKEQLAKF